MKKKSFLELAKWKRKNKVYNLKYKIEKQRSEFKDNRLFYTHTYIYPEIKYEWMTVYFPSKKDSSIIYDAYITICQHKIYEDLRSELIQKCFDELTEDEEKSQDLFSNRKLIYHNNEKYYVYESNPVKLEKFNNRTVYEEIHNRLDSSFEQYSKDIFEYINFSEFNSKNGICLDFNIGSRYLDVNIINQYIEKFYYLNEKSWKNPNPLNNSNVILLSRNWRDTFSTSLANPLIDISI